MVNPSCPFFLTNGVRDRRRRRHGGFCPHHGAAAAEDRGCSWVGGPQAARVASLEVVKCPSFPLSDPRIC
jgi:hypothetical protein